MDATEFLQLNILDDEDYEKSLDFLENARKKVTCSVELAKIFDNAINDFKKEAEAKRAEYKEAHKDDDSKSEQKAMGLEDALNDYVNICGFIDNYGDKDIVALVDKYIASTLDDSTGINKQCVSAFVKVQLYWFAYWIQSNAKQV